MMFRVDDVLNGLGGLRRFTCTHRDSGTPLDSAPLELELDLHTSGSLTPFVEWAFGGAEFELGGGDK